MRSSIFAPAFLATALVLASLAAKAEGPLTIARQGSLEAGGETVFCTTNDGGDPLSTRWPKGRVRVSHVYASYQYPFEQKYKYPILFNPGGGHTARVYDTTPDGREGWLNMFIRKGWDVYVSDAVERGRAGFASADVWPSEPIFLNYADPFERFRIGDGEGSWNADPAKRRVLPGNQFPVEAYDNYMRQAVPRWLSTDKAVVDAYVALVDKVCPCVLLLHSQGGAFGFRVAEQRPDKVKAIVAVESATAGDAGKAAALKNTPTLMLFGDYVDQHPRWAAYKKIDLEYAAAVRAGGGTVDVINLPDIGIKGNSHMLMQDKNNAEIADVIQIWMVGKGLVE